MGVEPTAAGLDRLPPILKTGAPTGTHSPPAAMIACACGAGQPAPMSGSKKVAGTGVAIDCTWQWETYCAIT